MAMSSVTMKMSICDGSLHGIHIVCIHLTLIRMENHNGDIREMSNDG
jgi:hypothetical protein